MPHTHIIDGKQVNFDDATCTICHPNALPATPSEKETLPRVYRKSSNCAVLKISKGQVMTTTYWEKEKAYLLGISKMARDASGKVMLNPEKKPLWNKTTVRLSATILKEYITELAKLLADMEGGSIVPTRA